MFEILNDILIKIELLVLANRTKAASFLENKNNIQFNREIQNKMDFF